MQAPNQYDPFWQLSLGNLLTILLFGLAFWAQRRESKKMHEENIQRMATMTERVALMFDWFTQNVIGNKRSR